MARRIAPLTALRAFEATARRRSVTEAAAELGVTPGAISQSVKALEAYLGRQLLRRTSRGLELTDVAANALPRLSAAFDALAEASRDLAGAERGGLLTVSVAPAFAAKWLAPRLADFAARYPEVDVRIDAAMGLADFAADGVDLAIRYGAGHWPGLESRLLMAESVTPVCAPGLAETIKAPVDLAGVALIHDDSSRSDESCPDWAMWLRAAGVGEIDAARGPRFNQSNLAIETALSGRGVALAKRALAQDDLDSGRLVAPFEISTPLAFAYWIVHPPGKLRARTAQQFVGWLEAAAATHTEAMARDVSYVSSAL
jgi:LysR family transcriptional regulator, glycine cleavage system transcriptional activator